MFQRGTLWNRGVSMGSEATDPLNALRTGFRSWMGNRITPSNTSESISRLFKFINHEGAKNTPHINATTWNAPHINIVGIRISFTHLGFVLIVPISSECMTNATDNCILNSSPCDYHSLVFFSWIFGWVPLPKDGFRNGTHANPVVSKGGPCE